MDDKDRTAPLQRRWIRRLLAAVAALLALWAIAWAALPPLIKWQIEQQATQALGRRVSVGGVDFRPWSLELALARVSVADAAGQSEQFGFDRLQVDAELSSLLRLAPVVDSIRLDHPRVKLRHLGGGRYDIDDLLAKFANKDDEPDKPLPRFALFNVAIGDGEIDFADDAVGRTQQLRALQLTLPFLGNLDARRETPTEPRLSFTLNGARFDTQARTLPFASSRRSAVELKVQKLELAPWLPYWPAVWPLRPRSGEIDIDLALKFEQREAPELVVSGRIEASGFAIDEIEGERLQPLLGWDRLELALEGARPLARELKVAALRWEGPELQLRRDAQGRLNPQRIAQGFAAKPDAAEQPKPQAGWRIALKQFELAGARLRWQDETTRPAADLQLNGIALSANGIEWPSKQPFALEGSASLGEGRLNWSGRANEREAAIELKLADLPLALARPYLVRHLKPELSGRIAAEAEIAWKAADGDRPMQLELRAPRAEVARLALGPAKKPLAGWSRLAIEELAVQPAESRVALARLVLEQPGIDLARDAGGRWNFEDWLIAAAADKAKGQPAAKAAAPAWQVDLGEFRIVKGRVALADDTKSRPVRLQVGELDLQARNVNPLSPAAALQPFSISLKLGADERGPAGRLSYEGRLRLPPSGKVHAGNAFATDGRLKLDALPLHLLEPYFGDALNLSLIRADASWRGSLAASLPPAGPMLKLRGDGAVDQLHADQLQPAERLLDWKSLSLRGVELDVERGALARLQVAETVLSDYFARVIIDERGRINLQQLLREPAGGAQATTTAAASPAAAPSIKFGPVAFVNGKVRFSDRFIQPNYSADLSELGGSLGAFDNRPPEGEAPQLAELSLRGRAEGSATLEIGGRLNPLARPLALDVRGVVRELELPPLSPYSVRYAGYGIERGKLSMDVRYQIQPDGRLNASNQLTLNQLSFGERVEGSQAPNLPVKLAVALLADRNGVIDVNLPISGSINDPDFRIGALVWRMAVNLIGKAVTAPFSLIASAFGGGEEFSEIVFSPGSAALDAASIRRLEQVAAAMNARETLKLTISGASDLDAERDGYRRERLRDLVRAEKRRDLARAGASEEAAEFSEAEYPALLKRAYQRAKIAKPRNLIGIARDLPLPEMETLLLASVAAGPDQMRELALARSGAVRDRLVALKVAPERLFFGSPQGKAGDDWKPQAGLKLGLD